MWSADVDENSDNCSRSEEAGADISVDQVCIPVPNGERALCWIAALAAARIPYDLEHDRDQWYISVRADWADAADAEIREYEQVNRDFPPPEVFPGKSYFPTFPHWTAGLIVVAAIMIFDLIRGHLSSRFDFVEEGILRTSAVLEGDYVRVVTALTLHADLPHLLGNALAGLLLVSIAAGWLGTGVALLLVVVAGALGNLTTALLADSPYEALGASTAIFGSLGMLTAMQVGWNIRRFRYRHMRQLWRRSWVVPAAAVALLGIMGTGPRSDVGGHLFGFVAGIVLGIAPALSAEHQTPGALVQWAAGVLALVVLVGSWGLALWE